MPGVRYLFITKDSDVYRIPIPKDFEYKAMPKLANEEVLQVVLCYNTINRKPHKLFLVQFNRINLDTNGQYRYNDDQEEEELRHQLAMMYQTPKTLSESNEPLPIPISLTIPTNTEKDTLKKYIKKHIPQLVDEGFQFIEQEIQSRNKKNQDNKRLIIEAAKLRMKGVH